MADLMPCINDFLVVSIIPIMEYIVYPHLERVMKMKILPLHKVKDHHYYFLYYLCC